MGEFAIDHVVVNLAYVVSVAALAVRELLRLRVLLLLAQVFFLWWGVLLEYFPTIAWNGLFLTINAAMIGRILWERRAIEIPEAFQDLHQSLFAGMSARDFLLFWELGNPHRLEHGTLVHQGEYPEALKLILDGSAGVFRNGEHVADVTRGGFVAEMSLLTGAPASADVRVGERVQFVSWSRRKLESLEQLNPRVYLELHKALGRDVSRKVAGEATPDPV